MVGQAGGESPPTGESERKSRRGDVVANGGPGERSVVLVGTGDGRATGSRATCALNRAAR